MRTLWELREGGKIHRISEVDKRNFTYSDGIQLTKTKEGIEEEHNTGIRYYNHLSSAIKYAARIITNEKEIKSLNEYMKILCEIGIAIASICNESKKAEKAPDIEAF